MESAGAGDGIFPPLFDLRAAWNTLWRQRRLIVLATAGVVLLAGLYVLVTKPVYTATASVLVDPRDTRAVSFNNVLPGIGADSAAIASQVNVIESQDLLGAVFNAQNIASDPEFDGQGRLARLMSIFVRPRPVSRDVIFRRFQNGVSVAREGLTYVIDVSFTSHDPEKAARIANAIVERYKASQAGENESANSDVSAVLNDKIAGLQKSVSDAERAVEDFKFAHRIYDANAGGTLQSQIDQSSAQLVTAQDQADKAEDKYRQALAAGTSPDALARLSGILSSPTTDKLRDDYNQRAAALANLETVYGPKHPAVVRLQTELEKVKGLMAAEAQRITRELKASRDLAVQNVQNVQNKITELRDRANQSDLAGVQLRQLQRSADAARAVLDDFLKRAQETSQLNGLQISQVRVISPAATPAQPAWPKPFLLLPVSAVLGFLGGCGLALAFGEPGAALTVARRPEKQWAPTPAAAQTPTASIDILGTFAVPVPAGGSWKSGLRNLRAHMSNDEGPALSPGLLHMLQAIVDRLGRADKPFLLLFASLEHGPMPALASALVGMGLQSAGEDVLAVDVNPRPAARAPLLSLGRSSASGPTTDPATGLRTLSLAAPDGAEGPGLPERILATAGSGFDFLLVNIGALGEASWDADLIASADLLVFALGPDEADAPRMLCEILPASLRPIAAAMFVTTAQEDGAAAPHSDRDGRIVANG